METHVTDEQQLETIKKWWQANGSSIITGVILGIAVLFGGKAWFAWRENIAQQASDIYTSMAGALEQGDRMATIERASMLISDYSGTPYAALAALAIARLRVEEGELEAAQTQLQWVVDNADADYTRLIARLRLARVMLALEDVDGAEAVLLAAGPAADTEVMFVELKGDIYSARGHQEQAATAYSQALSIAAPDYPGSHLLQLKYDNARALADDGTETGQ
ncbi:MAG TPA: tetratricopeptide repeat protein [Gammaproteobacteria bacterium]|nr:tetratricopeptide repeat protein [Gammaproteobacteria bacterium]